MRVVTGRESLKGKISQRAINLNKKNVRLMDFTDIIECYKQQKLSICQCSFIAEALLCFIWFFFYFQYCKALGKLFAKDYKFILYYICFLVCSVTSQSYDKCFLGSSETADANRVFCGQLGAIYVFSEALNPAQIFAIHQLGPGYKVRPLCSSLPSV